MTGYSVSHKRLQIKIGYCVQAWSFAGFRMGFQPNLIPINVANLTSLIQAGTLAFRALGKTLKSDRIRSNDQL